MSRRGRGGWYSTDDFSQRSGGYQGTYQSGPGSGGGYGSGRNARYEEPRFREGYGNRGQRNRGRNQQGPRIAQEPHCGACNYFAVSGSCRYGDGCRYYHCLRRVGWVPSAHDDSMIQCMEVAPFDLPEGSIQIFTGDKDGLLKRWTARPNGSAAAPPSPAAAALVDDGLIPMDAIRPNPQTVPKTPEGAEFPQYTLELSSTSTFQSPVTSVMLSTECLFVGLHSGVIHGYLTTGKSQFELTAHSGPVHSILLIDNILVTGDFSGNLMFWRPSADATGNPTFSMVQQMRVENGIKCLREISFATHEGVIKTLWVGCVTRVLMINLQTLTITMNHQLPQRDNGKLDVCMDILPFNNTVLAACLTGSLLQFAQTGELMQTYQVGMDILVLTGILGPTGPCAAIGAQLQGTTDESAESGLIAVYDLSKIASGAATLPKLFSIGVSHKRVRCLRGIDPSLIPGMREQPAVMVVASELGQLSMWTMSSDPDSLRQRRR